MQLTASRLAQFFIQDEYYQVEIKDQQLILGCGHHEIQIPFSAWDGHITIERGLVWGNLAFHSHPEGEQQIQWQAQGLPWLDCRTFALQAIGEYRRWFNSQIETLLELIPVWQQQLQTLVNQPRYLSHSVLLQWIEQVSADLAKKDILLAEAIYQLPPESASLRRWLLEPEASIEQRNQTWLSNEAGRWQEYFNQCERTPLNSSQQQAVLLNDDHNLVIAGAGSGKTSVLMARVGYLLQSGQAQAHDLLLVAFGREAANEMKQRLQQKLGAVADDISVLTFHQLGLSIIKKVDGDKVTLSPIVSEAKQKKAWLSQWLKSYWLTASNFKRWQKHLSQWPIAYLKGDDELGTQVENPKLLAWLEQQLDQLCAMLKSKKDIQELIVHLEDYPRLNSELSLVWPCYQAWQAMLKEKNQIDFHSMITLATRHVQQGKFKPDWQFVMVDEYQDISPYRLALLQTICDKSNHTVEVGEVKQTIPCSLFAVGDDWQAIYRFAGADVNLTTGFKQRFEHAQVHYLDTTYRFNNQIGAVANSFIQKNPHQLPKDLISHKQQKRKAVTIAPMKSLPSLLNQLNKQQDHQVRPLPRVLLLGRNHYHKPDALNDWQQQNPHLKIDFMTCHASKGQEADYVFILNVDDGQFPAVERQVHLNHALLQDGTEFPDAEERRLFYVAMTRAKQQVWILHSGNQSSFIKELRSARYPIIVKKR